MTASAGSGDKIFIKRCPCFTIASAKSPNVKCEIEAARPATVVSRNQIRMVVFNKFQICIMIIINQTSTQNVHAPVFATNDGEVVRRFTMPRSTSKRRRPFTFALAFATT
jgi:hypothetical protein